jgi:riboflavin synthase
MFTGLVTGKGMIRSRRDGRLEIETPLAGELAAGDSIAVNGVCLTAVDPEASHFAADVMPETLRRSSLGPLSEGSEVNVELPLRAGDRLGGHVVQGHVDATGSVAAEPELLRYVVEKGSIAVDGVSLTVSAVDDEAFEVSLIPETLERTTLGQAERDTMVNLEVDVLAKYVEKLIRSQPAEPAAHARR